MARVTGDKKHVRTLRKLKGPAAQQLIGQAIYVASDMLKTEAQHSIVAGSVSGAGHVPSAPGEPPNADTRQLDTNIINRMTGPTKAEVSSNAPYSAALEFGTSRMAERPFMRPAAEKVREAAQNLVMRAVNRALKS